MASLQRNISLPQLLPKLFDEPISSVTPSSGSNPGDNVIGKMLSLRITLASGSVHSLVVKALIPFNESDLSDLKVTIDGRLFARSMSKFCVFTSELNYYTKVKPEMDLQFPGYSLPTPAFVYGTDGLDNGGLGDDATLILEDLRPQGYKMADKFKGLNLKEFSMVLEKLAKFHAASHVYICRNPGALLKSICHHSFAHPKVLNFCDETHNKFLSDLYFGFLNASHEAGDIGDELWKKIERVTQPAGQPEEVEPRDIIISTSDAAMSEFFPVLIHGDLWVNNVLFKYDETESPVDLRFIDFQESRRASVYDDLHYFVYTSTTKEFRDEHLKAGLDLYYDHFMETLKELKAEVPAGFSRERLHQGFRKYLKAAFCYNVMAIPFQLGVAPKFDTTDNSKEKNNAGGPGENNNEGDGTKSLEQFTSDLFGSIAKDLVPGAMNSPIARRRLLDVCREMEALGVLS